MMHLGPPALAALMFLLPPAAPVSGQWPPTFLFHAADDVSVFAEGSIRLFSVLRAAEVAAEIHVFQSGGHGFGIRRAEGPVANWPMLCGEWMTGLGLVNSP